MQTLKTNNNHTFLTLIITVLSVLFFQNVSANKNPDSDAILEQFVQSYKTDNMALTTTFGIQIDQQWWHVKAKRVQQGYKVKDKYTFHNFGPNQVSLHQGKPKSPTWYFKLADKTVLNNIHSGVWSASTAAMRSMPSDVVALDIVMMDGFKSSKKVDAISYQVLEHFWKTGEVEIAKFSRDSSLPTHGVAAVSLYTMKDKRIAWFSITKEEAANAEPHLDKGQVPNLFIFTKGKGVAKLGTEEIEVQAGMSVFVGPYIKHAIFNPNDEPLEGVLVLFGDNIDYALGESYLDSQERLYDFLGQSQL
jgi:mannose-6-phosphate isomerase-like protein (cupin superfamily)